MSTICSSTTICCTTRNDFKVYIYFAFLLNFISVALSLLDLPSIQPNSSSVQDILLSLSQHSSQLSDSLLTRILSFENLTPAHAQFAGRLCSLKVKNTAFGKHLYLLKYVFI
jgi:hypothetical protein